MWKKINRILPIFEPISGTGCQAIWVDKAFSKLFSLTRLFLGIVSSYQIGSISALTLRNAFYGALALQLYLDMAFTFKAHPAQSMDATEAFTRHVPKDRGHYANASLVSHADADHIDGEGWTSFRYGKTKSRHDPKQDHQAQVKARAGRHHTPTGGISYRVWGLGASSPKQKPALIYPHPHVCPQTQAKNFFLDIFITAQILNHKSNKEFRMALETLRNVAEIGGFPVVVMDKLRDKYPERFNESGAIYYKWFEKEIRPFKFVYVRHDVNSISFTIQNGPIKEVGVNGCQVDTLIHAAKLIIEGLNAKFPCRENALVITKLDEAIMWLEKRTKDREKRNVEGTSQA